MILDSSRVETIDRLLSGTIIYKVPRYQRSFSWEKEHIETFWEDLMETRIDRREDYFLGSMIFRKISQDEMEIIDGQQRVGVLIIFFSCIRDHYLDLGDTVAVSEINTTYIGRRIGRLTRQFKLKLNEHDNTFFQTYIQEDNPTRNFARSRGLPNSHKLILNARNLLYEKIREELDKFRNDDEKKDFLQEIASIVAHRFKVLSTYVDTPDEAYIVFETLNDRGLDLSIADLLKNYLYSKAGETLDDIRIMWEEIMDMLDSREISQFLRYYWISTKGLAREKELYRVLKNHIRNNREVHTFVRELRREAEIYNNLINPSCDYWEDMTLVALLEELKTLGVKQIYPLLLGGYAQFRKSKAFKKLINSSIILTFRYSIICGLNPNRLEREYSEIAIKLRHGQDLGYVKHRFSQLNPDEETFLHEFERKEITNQRIARYLLAKISNYSMRGRDICVETSVNLEHIMPQKLNSEWEKYISKNNLEHGELVNRIGNLTLLTGPRNIAASNKLFKIKCKETYIKSDLPITKELCNYKEWDEETINERQIKLAGIGKNVWKL